MFLMGRTCVNKANKSLIYDECVESLRVFAYMFKSVDVRVYAYSHAHTSTCLYILIYTLLYMQVLIYRSFRLSYWSESFIYILRIINI